MQWQWQTEARSPRQIRHGERDCRGKRAKWLASPTPHAPVEPVEDERLIAMDDVAADVEDGAGHGKRSGWRWGERAGVMANFEILVALQQDVHQATGSRATPSVHRPASS